MFDTIKLIPASSGYDQTSAQKDLAHFPAILADTGIPYFEMIFFDDEHKNVQRVRAEDSLVPIGRGQRELISFHDYFAPHLHHAYETPYLLCSLIYILCLLSCHRKRVPVHVFRQPIGSKDSLHLFRSTYMVFYLDDWKI
jgi:hypothetical protein